MPALAGRRRAVIVDRQLQPDGSWLPNGRRLRARRGSSCAIPRPVPQGALGSRWSPRSIHPVAGPNGGTLCHRRSPCGEHPGERYERFVDAVHPRVRGPRYVLLDLWWRFGCRCRHHAAQRHNATGQSLHHHVVHQCDSSDPFSRGLRH